MKILMISSKRDVNEFISQESIDRTFRVDTAKTLSEGFKLLLETQWDILLLDDTVAGEDTCARIMNFLDDISERGYEEPHQIKIISDKTILF